LIGTGRDRLSEEGNKKLPKISANRNQDDTTLSLPPREGAGGRSNCWNNRKNSSCLNNPALCLLFCKPISGQYTKRPPLTSRNKFPDIKAGQAGTGSPRRGTRKFPKKLQTNFRTRLSFLIPPFPINRDTVGG